MAEESTILFTDDLDGFIAKRNDSDGYALIVHCMAGRMQIDLNQERFEIVAGDLLFCHPKFIVGNYMRTPDFRCRLIGIAPHAIDEVAFLCIREDNLWWEKTQYLLAHPILHLTERQAALLDVFAELNSIYNTYETTTIRLKIKNVFLQAGILEIFSWLEELVMKEAASEKPSQKEVIFRRFVMLLRQVNGAQREVRWFANELSISPKYLTTVCRSFSGHSASELIGESTLQEIKRLLQQTDYSTKEISARLGFTNLSFFCKFVKRGLGMTASDYRRTQRNNVFAKQSN